MSIVPIMQFIVDCDKIGPRSHGRSIHLKDIAISDAVSFADQCASVLCNICRISPDVSSLQLGSSQPIPFAFCVHFFMTLDFVVSSLRSRIHLSTTNSIVNCLQRIRYSITIILNVQ